MRTNNNAKYSFIAFCLGVISNLFVETPVGFWAMLDMLSLAVAGPLLLMEWRCYPKRLKTLILLLVCWCANAAVSDWYRGTPFMPAFKYEFIIFNCLCLIALAAWVLRKSQRAIGWYIAGTAISMVISLYKFQNGALMASAMLRGFSGVGSGMTDYLIEKQVKPIWVSMFLFVGVFSLRRFWRVPWAFCVCAFAVGAFYVLLNGGSRSGFLISMSSAILMAVYAYAPKLYEVVFERKLIVLIVVAVAAVFFNAAYLLAAKNGFLGEMGYKKWEEKNSGVGGMLDNRSDILINWPFLWRSPIIGAGTEMIDHWGYVNQSDLVSHEVQGRYRDNSTFYGHSCVVMAWTAHGIFGLLFWVYILWLAMTFLGQRVYVLGDSGPFVMASIISVSWHILFSPFGGRGSKMFMAVFLALAMDKNFRRWLIQGLSMKEVKDYHEQITDR